MKNILLFTFVFIILSGCSKQPSPLDGQREMQKLIDLCKGMDNACYRKEYAKDIANSPASKKFGMIVTTEGEEDKTIVYQTNQLTTASLSSTKDVFVDLSRMGTFRQIKFIGSDSKQVSYSTGFDK